MAKPKQDLALIDDDTLDRLTRQEIISIHLQRMMGDLGEEELLLQFLQLLQARRTMLPEEIEIRRRDFEDRLKEVFA